MTLSLLVITALVLALLWGFRIFLRSNPLRKPNMEFSNALQPTKIKDYTLEENYQDDKLVALIKDPYWLYCYWDLSEQTKGSFCGNSGVTWDDTNTIIRIFDHDDNIFWDFPVNNNASDWYFRVGRPHHTLHLEFGILMLGSTFIPLLRSNIVTMPADSISREIDPMWPPLDEIWQSVPSEKLKRSFPGSSEVHSHS